MIRGVSIRTQHLGGRAVEGKPFETSRSTLTAPSHLHFAKVRCDLGQAPARQMAHQRGVVGTGIMRAMAYGLPGSGRYSQIEREQRWLLREVPEGLVDPVQIHDIYLRDTNLRLRRMESPQGVIWKLGQKVRERPESPEIVRLTNIYLAEREYNVLTTLAGAQLSKTRWHWVWRDRGLSVDVFDEPLKGLVLAEIELGPPEIHLDAPVGALADVTYNNQFSGGVLAWATPEEARQLVARVLN